MEAMAVDGNWGQFLHGLVHRASPRVMAGADAYVVLMTGIIGYIWRRAGQEVHYGHSLSPSI
jgi:hypothetical protein